MNTGPAADFSKPLKTWQLHDQPKSISRFGVAGVLGLDGEGADEAVDDGHLAGHGGRVGSVECCASVAGARRVEARGQADPELQQEAVICMAVLVRSCMSDARTRYSFERVCCASVLGGAKRIIGREAASQFALTSWPWRRSCAPGRARVGLGEELELRLAVELGAQDRRALAILAVKLQGVLAQVDANPRGCVPADLRRSETRHRNVSHWGVDAKRGYKAALAAKKNTPVARVAGVLVRG